MTPGKEKVDIEQKTPLPGPPAMSLSQLPSFTLLERQDFSILQSGMPIENLQQSIQDPVLLSHIQNRQPIIFSVAENEGKLNFYVLEFSEIQSEPPTQNYHVRTLTEAELTVFAILVEQLRENQHTLHREVATLRNKHRRFTRRTLLGGGIAAAAGIAAGAVIAKWEQIQWLMDKALKPSTPEVVDEHSAIETVLENSGFEAADGQTKADKLLYAHAVSEHLFDGKFQYTGRSDKDRERIHKFAVVGSVSKFIGRDGAGKDRDKTTSLADAINNLLDYERLSDDEIKFWICSTYFSSFGITDIDPSRIIVIRNPSTNEVENVIYDPQDGFETHVCLSIPREIEGLAATEPGGNLTTSEKYFKILGDDNSLKLLSGLSPKHDLQVPHSILPSAKQVKLLLKNDSGEVIELDLTLTDLVNAIKDFQQRSLFFSSDHVTGTLDSTPFAIKSCAPYILANHPKIQELVEKIVATSTTSAEEIKSITHFVQSLRAANENDRDFNRNPILALFNGGGDCNNLLIVWSSLMSTRGHEHYLLYVPREENETVAHVLGAIPSTQLAAVSDEARSQVSATLADFEIQRSGESEYCISSVAPSPTAQEEKNFRGHPVVELAGGTRYSIGSTFIDGKRIAAGQRIMPTDSGLKVELIK